MLNKRALLATSALAVIAGVGQAQAGNDYYVSLFGGANWQIQNNHATQRSSFTTGPYQVSVTTGYDLKSKTGFVIGGALGKHLDSWVKGLRVDVEASYRSNDVGGDWFANTSINPIFAGTQGGKIDATESTFSVLANVWYDVDVGQKWVPYIGGGAGWARTKVDGAFITTFTSSGPVLRGHGFSHQESGFAWQLGAGLNYEIQDGIHLGLGYRYFRGPDLKNDIFVGKNHLPVNFDNENHSVTVNLTVDTN